MDAQAVTRAKAPRRAPRRAGATDSQVDRLLARVATDFEALPRQLKSVARYVEQHRARVMVDRIGDVARECAVQPSAVVRFAQRFGYAGFSAMQAVFRDDYTQQAAASTTYQQRIRRLVTSKRRALTPVAVAREFVAASTAGLEELSRDFDDAALSSAVSLLARAQHIYVVGVRRSYPVAAYMTYALQHIDKRVQLVDGIGGMVHEQMRSIGRDDVIVAISFTPYGRETLACVRHAQKMRGEVGRDDRQPAGAARSRRERAARRARGRRVRVPLADQRAVPRAGAVRRARLPAGARRRGNDPSRRLR